MHPQVCCSAPLQPVQHFVRLSMRSALRPSAAAAAAVATPLPSILDLLLPPSALHALRSQGRRSFAASSLGARHARQQQQQPPSGRVAPPPAAELGGAATLRSRRPAQQIRGFATTPRRQLTMAAYNPQKDEDGNEMSLEITPRAAKRLSEIMVKDSNPGLALRIQVESGGCHGFQYLMSLVTLPTELPAPPPAPSSEIPEQSENGSGAVVREDDTIFTYAQEDAGAGTNRDGLASTPKIVLDTPSLELLKGSKVDFTMELIGSQFKIVDNPLATSSCGCGTSFDIKF